MQSNAYTFLKVIYYLRLLRRLHVLPYLSFNNALYTAVPKQDVAYLLSLPSSYCR
jgi:hypothetical protein